MSRWAGDLRTQKNALHTRDGGRGDGAGRPRGGGSVEHTRLAALRRVDAVDGAEVERRRAYDLLEADWVVVAGDQSLPAADVDTVNGLGRRHEDRLPATSGVREVEIERRAAFEDRPAVELVLIHGRHLWVRERVARELRCGVAGHQTDEKDSLHLLHPPGEQRSTVHQNSRKVNHLGLT